MQLCAYFRLTFALKSSFRFPWQQSNLTVQLNKSTLRFLLGILYLPAPSKFPHLVCYYLALSVNVAFTHRAIMDLRHLEAKKIAFAFSPSIFFLPWIPHRENHSHKVWVGMRKSNGDLVNVSAYRCTFISNCVHYTSQELSHSHTGTLLQKSHRWPPASCSCKEWAWSQIQGKHKHKTRVPVWWGLRRDNTIR